MSQNPQKSALPAQTADGPQKPAPAKPVPAEQSGPAAPPRRVRATAAPARPRKRHWGALVSFIIMVILPTLLAIWYLAVRAADQYASNVAFSVRSEEMAMPSDLLQGLGQVVGSGSNDADVLYEFLRSQGMVEQADAALDLRTLWSKPDGDPVFAFDPEGSLEDLVDYWNRMVQVSYDSGSGLISVEAFAFSAEDAQALNEVVTAESGRLVDELSHIAREDTMTFAQEELDKATDRLRDVRLRLAQFRDSEQIIDPKADVEGQMGVLTALQQELAGAMIQLDVLRGTTRAGDPRIEQAQRKISALRQRISDERANIGNSGGQTDALSSVIGDYESLLVDREFAEQAYIAAQVSYDTAVSEARRKSRYLAAHIKPTLPESAQYPKRVMLGLMAFGIALVIWLIMILSYYAVRDGR